MFKLTDGEYMRNETEKDLELTIDVFEKLIPTFNAIGDSTRQKILIALGRNKYLNVNEICDFLPLSRPAISHHLKQLKMAGLVDHDKIGTENRYYLTMKKSLEEIKVLIQLLETTCELY